MLAVILGDKINLLTLNKLNIMENKTNEWSAAWERALPYLALIGPGSWLIAALVKSAGISMLEDGLDWVSRREGTLS